jgi:excisionase family DNA binding protein
MGTEESGRNNLWLRVSAWLPPGLALAWLATLATLVRSVGMALTAWGATVSAILLAFLVIQRLRKGSSADDDDPVEGSEDAAAGETPQARTAVADPAESGLRPNPAESPETGEKKPHPDPRLRVGTPVVPGLPVPELHVLTAEEAASVLRVDAELVKASISNGELPGNHIGPHWRIEHGALTRWLQGEYKS